MASHLLLEMDTQTGSSQCRACPLLELPREGLPLKPALGLGSETFHPAARMVSSVSSPTHNVTVAVTDWSLKDNFQGNHPSPLGGCGQEGYYQALAGDLKVLKVHQGPLCSVYLLQDQKQRGN